MVHVGTVFYQCVKFNIFPVNGSMGCHRLKSGRNGRRRRRNLTYRLQEVPTFGAWPLIHYHYKLWCWLQKAWQMLFSWKRAPWWFTKCKSTATATGYFESLKAYEGNTKSISWHLTMFCARASTTYSIKITFRRLTVTATWTKHSKGRKEHFYDSSMFM